MPKVEKLLIFLASPGDVRSERRYVEEVIAEINRTIANDKGVILQLVTWEQDTFPGFGMDAQALINAQIAEMSKYALFVGIMWNRLGTPTPRASSGTVEEFKRAVDSLKQNGQPDIWFYFRQSKSSLDTEQQLDQRKAVLAFQKQVQASGMPSVYKSPSEFREKFRNHLILWLGKKSYESKGTKVIYADVSEVAEPQVRELMQKADVIMGVDRKTDARAVFYGRERLLELSRACYELLTVVSFGACDAKTIPVM
jgi:hypothetical protein